MPAATEMEPAQAKRLPVWRLPAVWRVLLIALLAEIGYAVLNISTMPVYLKAVPGPNDGFIPNGRGMGESVIGFVLVAFLLSEAVLKGPMGSLADRYGHKRLIVIGPLITVFTPLLTLVVPHQSGGWEVFGLILLRVFDGVGSAMLWPAAFALIGNSVEDHERQQAMSLLNLCYMVGIAVALPIGGAINDLSGLRWASFVFAAVVFAVVVFAGWRWLPAHEARDNVHASAAHGEFSPREFVRSMRQIPGFLTLAIVVFAGIGFPTVILKLFAEDELHMTESQFGLLVLPAALSMALLSVPLSRYGERIGKARAVHWGIGMCAAGLAFVSLGAFLPILRMPWALALGAIPMGVGFLLAIPAWMASVSDIDPARRGTNIGAVMTAQGLGAVIGMPIGSTLYEKLQPYGLHIAHYSPFLGCTACVFIGWLISLRVLREPRRP